MKVKISIRYIIYKLEKYLLPDISILTSSIYIIGILSIIRIIEIISK